jgi:hypothetical protein
MKRAPYAVYLLAFALVYNLTGCADPEANAPRQDFSQAFGGITLEAVDLDAPAPVSYTPGALIPSAKATTFTNALSAYNNRNPIPGPVATAANEMMANLTGPEINALNATTSAEIKTVSDGGSIPTRLQPVLTKMNGVAVLQAYFTSFTLPAVGSAQSYTPVEIPPVDKTPGITGSTNACVLEAEKAFLDALKRLDREREQDLAAVERAYRSHLAAVDANLRNCNQNTSNTFSGVLRTEQRKYDDLIRLVDRNQNRTALGIAYAPARALVYGLNLDFLHSVNVLSKAEANVCTEKAEKEKENAEKTRLINTEKVELAYAVAVAAAREVAKQLYETCHLQGSGS